MNVNVWLNKLCDFAELDFKTMYIQITLNFVSTNNATLIVALLI